MLCWDRDVLFEKLNAAVLEYRASVMLFRAAVAIGDSKVALEVAIVAKHTCTKCRAELQRHEEEHGCAALRNQSHYA